MKTAVHVLRKDLVHLRSYLALIYLLALGYWLGFAFTEISPELSLSLNLGFAGAVLLLVFIALRSDSSAENNSWWRTRPIASRQLFTAKLLLWFVGVALPFGVAVTALALRYQFSASQVLLANLEIFLVTGAVFSLLAVWLAIPNLKANVGINIGATFVFFILAIFISLGSLSQHNYLPETVTALSGRSLSLGLLAITLGSGAAWGFLVCFRSTPMAALCFTAGITIFFGSAIFSSQGRNLAFELNQNDGERIRISLLDQPSPPNPNRVNEYIYNHFHITGLKPREFGSLAYLKGTFRWPDGAISQLTDFNGAPGGSSRSSDDRILSQLKPIVLNEYPTKTTWTGDMGRHRRNFFPISMPDNSYQIRSTTVGDIQGKIMANILRVDPQGQFPLRKGIYRMEASRSLEIRNLDLHWDAIKLDFYITRPKLALSSDPESNLTSPYSNEHTRYLFVIYHPEQEEAYLLSHSYISLRTMKTLIPAHKQRLTLDIPFSNLRSAINGLSMSEWIRGAEIHPYKIQIVGIKKHEFSKNDYAISGDRSQRANPTIELDNLTLSEDPDEDQTRQYLKSVLSQIPDQYSNAAIQQIRAKIGEIPSKHLPILLSLLPGSEGIVNTYLSRSVNQLVRPEHRNAFAKLWETRNDFIHLAQKMDWVDSLSTLFIRRLKSRDTLSPWVVAYAARAKAPETYSDLAWHFAHIRWGHDLMLRDLRQCPGFDWKQAVKHAWSRARLEIINRNGLSIPAAELGLPDGLGAAAILLEERNESQRKAVAETIRKFVDPPELNEPFSSWFLSHLEELRFDQESGRYRIQ